MTRILLILFAKFSNRNYAPSSKFTLITVLNQPANRGRVFIFPHFQNNKWHYKGSRAGVDQQRIVVNPENRRKGGTQPVGGQAAQKQSLPDFNP